MDLKPFKKDHEEQKHEEEVGEEQDVGREEGPECAQKTGAAAPENPGYRTCIARYADGDRDHDEEKNTEDDEEDDIVLECAVQALHLGRPKGFGGLQEKTLHFLGKWNSYTPAHKTCAQINVFKNDEPLNNWSCYPLDQ